MTLLVVACTLPPEASRAQEEDIRGIMPVELSVLFSALPNEVKGWELTKSKGWMGHQKWFESSVVRDFKKEDASDPAEPVTRKVSLSLQDTGKFAESDIEIFSDFTPSVEDGGETLYIGSNPAVIMQGGNRVFTQILVKERFILSIAFTNVSRDDVGVWLKRVKVNELTSIKDGPVVGLPQSFVDQSVDELKEKKDYSYKDLTEDEDKSDDVSKDPAE